MRGDRSGLFLRYRLADRLHKTLGEIDAMTLEEFCGWQAFFLVDREKEKKKK